MKAFKDNMWPIAGLILGVIGIIFGVQPDEDIPEEATTQETETDEGQEG